MVANGIAIATIAATATAATAPRPSHRCQPEAGWIGGGSAGCALGAEGTGAEEVAGELPLVAPEFVDGGADAGVLPIGIGGGATVEGAGDGESAPDGPDGPLGTVASTGVDEIVDPSARRFAIIGWMYRV